MTTGSVEFCQMPQEHEPNSQDGQLLDSTRYLNEQIQAGARVTVTRHRSAYVTSDWPIVKVGDDFLVFKTDDGNETVIPRDGVGPFTIKKPTQNAHP